MKAAVYTRYGPPDVVQIKDVEKLVPKDNEVLIEVRAASVNALDGGLMKGRPYSARPSELIVDMWQPYKLAVREALPQATIVADKFHSKLSSHANCGTRFLFFP